MGKIHTYFHSEQETVFAIHMLLWQGHYGVLVSLHSVIHNERKQVCMVLTLTKLTVF